MATPRSERDLNKLVGDGVREDVHLEFKSVEALGNHQGLAEMGRQVAAMANADGGLIIYGIVERHEEEGLAAGVEGTGDKSITSDRLAQIIASHITPKVEGVRVHPIPLDDATVAFCIQVPKSSAAHQSKDHRYYRRHGAQTLPMEHYEVLELMHRRTAPVLTASATVVPSGLHDGAIRARLDVSLENQADAPVLYSLLRLWVPGSLSPRQQGRDADQENGVRSPFSAAPESGTQFLRKLTVPYALPIWRGVRFTALRLSISVPPGSGPLPLQEGGAGWGVLWVCYAPEMDTRHGVWVLRRDGDVLSLASGEGYGLSDGVST